MAQAASGDRLKRLLLLGFVVASIGLVALTWMEGLRGDQPATPGYYRGNFQMDDDVYLTVTAEALEFQDALSGTPPPPDAAEPEHGSGQGSGQGRGQGGDHAQTPTPGN